MYKKVEFFKKIKPLASRVGTMDPNELYLSFGYDDLDEEPDSEDEILGEDLTEEDEEKEEEDDEFSEE